MNCYRLKKLRATNPALLMVSRFDEDHVEDDSEAEDDEKAATDEDIISALENLQEEPFPEVLEECEEAFLQILSKSIVLLVITGFS